MTNEQALQWFRFKFDRAKDYYDEHWDATERREHKEYVEAMKCAIKALTDNSELKAADVQPAPKWISVKERLPEAVEEDVNGKIAFSDFVLVCLVYDDGFTYITNDQCRVDSKSWLNEIPGEGCKVTHWMPLPEPPKDGDVEV